jgi:DNA-binding MarR family transcriptional regulator
MKAITNNKWVLLLVIFLVMTNLALVFFAFSNAKPAERRDQKDFMKTKLHLTEEQDKYFKQKKEEYFSVMKPRWEEVNNLKDSLYQHIGDEQVSDSMVNYYIDKWTENTRQSDKKLFYHFRELRSRCNKDQQVIFDTLVPKIVKYQSRRK